MIQVSYCSGDSCSDFLGENHQTEECRLYRGAKHGKEKPWLHKDKQRRTIQKGKNEPVKPRNGISRSRYTFVLPFQGIWQHDHCQVGSKVSPLLMVEPSSNARSCLPKQVWFYQWKALPIRGRLHPSSIIPALPNLMKTSAQKWMIFFFFTEEKKPKNLKYLFKGRPFLQVGPKDARTHLNTSANRSWNSAPGSLRKSHFTLISSSLWVTAVK